MNNILPALILFLLFPALALPAEEGKPAAVKPDAAAIMAKEQEAYEKGLADIEKKFRAEHAAPAVEKYLLALDILIAQTEKSNNQELLAAARKEKDRAASEKNVPEPYPKGLPLPIKEIQYKYHKFIQQPKYECYSAMELHMQNYFKRMNVLVDFLLKHDEIQVAAKLEDDMKIFKGQLAKMAETKNEAKALAPPKYEPPPFVSKRHSLSPSLEKSLTAYYTFDADEETTVVDRTKKNNATLHGAKRSKDGKFESCYEFGGEHYIDAGKLLMPKPSSWAFSAWLKTVSMKDGGMVFYNGDYPNNGFGLNWFKGYWLILYGGKNQQNGAIGIIKTWQHLLLTCSDGQIKFYMDGRLAKSVEAKQSEFSGKTIIGSCVTRGDINGEWFRGSIDEVMIFNRGLTDQEATAVYECQGGEPVPEEEKEEAPSINVNKKTSPSPKRRNK